MQAAPWILRRTPKPNARARLFCLPFAGGSASAWRDWGERLPDWVEVLPVELPGRGMRLGEAPIPALLPLVESMLTGLAPWMDRPYALLGHSMGALLAFEATRILRARRQPLPFLLAVSGYRAPHLADPEPELRELSDGALLDRVRGLGGTPREILASKEIFELLLPVFRADFAVTETWTSPQEAPLALPLLVLGGLWDPRAPRPALEAWAQHAAGPLRMALFPGDHFFQRATPEPVARVLAEELSRYGPGPDA